MAGVAKIEVVGLSSGEGGGTVLGITQARADLAGVRGNSFRYFVRQTEMKRA